MKTAFMRCWERPSVSGGFHILITDSFSKPLSPLEMPLWYKPSGSLEIRVLTNTFWCINLFFIKLSPLMLRSCSLVLRAIGGTLCLYQND